MDPPPTNNTNIGGKFQIVKGAQVCKREGLSNSAGGERIPTLVKVAYEPMSPSPMSH